MKKKLFAFWSYDLFPYFIGGEITDIDEKGRVYAPSYQGWIKSPVVILPLKEGQKIKEKIRDIEEEYSKEARQLLKNNVKKIEALCPMLKKEVK